MLQAVHAALQLSLVPLQRLHGRPQGLGHGVLPPQHGDLRRRGKNEMKSDGGVSHGADGRTDADRRRVETDLAPQRLQLPVLVRDQGSGGLLELCFFIHLLVCDVFSGGQKNVQREQISSLSTATELN